MPHFDEYGQIISEDPDDAQYSSVHSIPVAPLPVRTSGGNEKVAPRRSSATGPLLGAAALLVVAGLIFFLVAPSARTDATVDTAVSTTQQEQPPLPSSPVAVASPPQSDDSNAPAIISSPTNTPLPPTAIQTDPRDAVQQGLEEYFTLRHEALRTSNIDLVTEVTTGRQLDKEVNTIRQDLATGAHHDIELLGWSVLDITVYSEWEASISVTKTENRLFFPQGCAVPDDTEPCRRPTNQQNTVRNETYSISYRLIKEDNRWKVEGYTLLP